ncbi:MAG TPA: CHAD domain-containing protein [Steroidobacteraceae bacterium]|jgi:CHAD domain-containing protein|nr:CHAD domain-containing protein [Steroidobacteraceae bacterium]
MKPASSLTVDSKPVHSLHEALLIMLADAGSFKNAGGNESFHGARKEMKRIRAALRLLRPALGRRAYRWANARVRDAARPLTAVRDATALLQTLDKLTHRQEDAVLRAPKTDLHRRLLRNCRAQRRAITPQCLRQISERLDQTADRLRARVPKMPDLAAAHRGMRKVYRAGRKAYRLARRQPTTEALHEWRKQVKYLYNDVELMCSAYRASLGNVGKRAQRLAALLGDDHDLAVLRQKVEEAEPGHGGPLLTGIRRARRALQAEAFAVGRRIYKGSPRRFASRVRKALRQP